MSDKIKKLFKNKILKVVLVIIILILSTFIIKLIEFTSC